MPTGENDVEGTHRNSKDIQQPVQVLDEEAGVFKDDKYGQVYEKAHSDDGSLMALGMGHQNTRQPCDYGRCGHEQRIFGVPAHIEEIAGYEQPNMLCPARYYVI